MKISRPAVLVLLALVTFTGQAFSASGPPLRASAVADKVLVLKRQRKLYLIQGSKVLKRYRVSLGGHPVGPKIREGDRKTPEGIYVLDWHNPESQFYKSIHISIPTQRIWHSRIGWDYRLAEICSFMASRMTSSGRVSNPAIGPTAALP